MLNPCMHRVSIRYRTDGKPSWFWQQRDCLLAVTLIFNIATRQQEGLGANIKRRNICTAAILTCRNNQSSSGAEGIQTSQVVFTPIHCSIFSFHRIHGASSIPYARYDTGQRWHRARGGVSYYIIEFLLEFFCHFVVSAHVDKIYIHTYIHTYIYVYQGEYCGVSDTHLIPTTITSQQQYSPRQHSGYFAIRIFHAV